MTGPLEPETGKGSPEETALRAADTLGAALRDSPQFARLVAAGETLAGDAQATAAIEAFGRKQAELRLRLMVGDVSTSERAELEQLETAMLACSAVAAYIAAEQEFRAICRDTAAMISVEIGIDFAASCQTRSCCG